MVISPGRVVARSIARSPPSWKRAAPHPTLSPSTSWPDANPSRPGRPYDPGPMPPAPSMAIAMQPRPSVAPSSCGPRTKIRSGGSTLSTNSAAVRNSQASWPRPLAPGAKWPTGAAAQVIHKRWLRRSGAWRSRCMPATSSPSSIAARAPRLYTKRMSSIFWDDDLELFVRQRQPDEMCRPLNARAVVPAVVCH